VEIDIFNYVNDAEIKEAILDGIKNYASSNAERVIANAGHHLATDIVNEKLGVNAEVDIALKAKEVISKLSSYTLFDVGGYGRPPSDARKLLDHCVRENKDDLSQAVKSAMHNLSKRDVMEIIKEGKFKMVVE
jgi:hypothetical protein